MAHRLRFLFNRGEGAEGTEPARRFSRVMTYELKRQTSGAFALHHRESRETMHPGRGPWEEANTLYVRGCGLADLLSPANGGKGRPDKEVVLFDVGLGAAANALAAIACHEQLRHRGGPVRPLRLISFENDLAPLRFALAHAAQLGYLLGHERLLESLAEKGCWKGNGGVEWELRLGDFPLLIDEEPRRADVVFFDPFSPRTNPAMWRLRTLESLYRCRKPGGDMRLATYSTAYGTRSGLLLAGFYVGDAGGAGAQIKGTTATAHFSTLERPLEPRWLQRWKHDQEPWPCLTPQPERRRLREALTEHPQWGQFDSGEQEPDLAALAGGAKPAKKSPFHRRRKKPAARPPRKGQAEH